MRVIKMDAENHLRLRNQLLLLAFLGIAYGLVCTILLFFYLHQVPKTVGWLIAISIFVIGGLCGWYGLLLSAFLNTQQEPEQSKTRHRLKVVSWGGAAW
jgi:hypothetical protein